MKNSKFQNPNSKKKQGYTLIELIVVISLSAILLLTAVSLFFTTFIGGGKTAAGEYTKQAGAQALSQMTFAIRNSRKLIANTSGVICGNNMSSIAVENQDGGMSVFSVLPVGGANQLASSSAIPVNAGNTRYLTPTDVSVVGGVNGIDFDCTPTNYGTSTWNGSPPNISLRFSLQKGKVGIDKARDIVSIPFATSITLRNF